MADRDDARVLTFAVTLLSTLAWYVPDVTVLAATRTVWGQNMAIVNTVYLLVVIAAGVVAMTHETFQVRYGIKELLPRLVLGFVAANFSFALLGLVLRFADAVVRALAGAPLGDDDTRGVVELHVTSALANPTNAVLSLIMALMAVVLLIVLVAQWYVRLGILVILAMVAPLALACYALPGLDQAAGIWWRSMLTGVESTCKVLSEHGCSVAARTYRSWRGANRPAATRTLTDAVVVDALLAVRGTPDGLYGRRKMAAHLRRQGRGLRTAPWTG